MDELDLKLATMPHRGGETLEDTATFKTTPTAFEPQPSILLALTYTSTRSAAASSTRSSRTSSPLTQAPHPTPRQLNQPVPLPRHLLRPMVPRYTRCPHRFLTCGVKSLGNVAPRPRACVQRRQLVVASLHHLLHAVPPRLLARDLPRAHGPGRRLRPTLGAGAGGIPGRVDLRAVESG